MPVVVNEFEVVNEPAPQTPQTPVAQSKSGLQVDVSRVVAELRARDARVRTY